MKWLMLAAVCIGGSGCVTNYARLHYVSSPPGAHVDIPATGEYLDTAPDNRIVGHRFFLLQRREAALQLRFRSGTRDCSDLVTVRVKRELWHPTRKAAEAAPNYASVIGFPRCADPQ